MFFIILILTLGLGILIRVSLLENRFKSNINETSIYPVLFRHNNNNQRFNSILRTTKEFELKSNYNNLSKL
jgi:hypothetical protein